MNNYKRKTHIFLGSSITEFEEERQILADYIFGLRDILEDNDISIEPIPEMCEFEDTAMSPTRKQDDFNELIDRSDLCIFMFGNKAGGYSVEELLTALARVKENGTDIPQINCFFRNPEEEIKVDRMVDTLRILLDERYVHYSDGSSFRGNIKLRISQNISTIAKDKELFPVSFSIEDEVNGRCKYLLKLKGKKILDLDETDLFETDMKLREARAEYEKEVDASRKNDIRMKLESMVGNRLDLV